MPYTVYAHFFLVREVLLDAGVKKVEYSKVDLYPHLSSNGGRAVL